MATFQPKVEKKIMDEKVAKIREVVKNISTNDIVLALHNFELDVARTIHAFCEGGSDIALGDWERTSAGKKRNQKKKVKANANSQSQSSVNTPKETSGATTPSVTSATYSNGFPANFAEKLTLTNGDLMRDNSTAALKCANFEFSVASAGYLANHQQFIPVEMNAKIPSTAVNHQPTVVDGGTALNLKDDFDNSFGLIDYQSLLEQNKIMFEREVATAQANISQCFKELRDALTIREQQLLAELTQCQKDGLLFFGVRKTTLQNLIMESAQPKNKSFVSKLEKFNASKTEDLEAALTSRVFYDNSTLISSISQLGKVVPVKLDEYILANNEKNGEPSKGTVAPPTPTIEKNVKRSNSPSSLVSSVGEDSGLGGQISPVNHEKAPVVQVEENGIVLKSDSVSADQLAEIQRQIAESLKAKGIDPSILSNINTTAPRRRPPNPSTKNGMYPDKTGKNGSSTTQGAAGERSNLPKASQKQNGGEKRK